jgi:SAM-dependent methyltransferase
MGIKMIDIIRGLINGQQYSEARQQVESYKEDLEFYDDVLAILEATLYLQEGNWKEAFLCIQGGLRYNPRNYELYYMLGNYYESFNAIKAYHCFEKAVFYCHNEDLEFLLQQKEQFLVGHEITLCEFDQEIIDLIKYDSYGVFSLLYVGTECPAALTRLKSLYPNASVTCLKVQELKLAVSTNNFDYIIVGGLLEKTTKPHALLRELQPYLSEEGVILGSVNNFMFAQNLSQLLSGRFPYLDSRVFPNEQLRFYTLEEIQQLAKSNGYQIKDLYFTTREENYSDLCKRQYEGLEAILGRKKELLKAYQFFFSLEKKGDQSLGRNADYIEEKDDSMGHKEVISLISHEKEEEFSVLEIGCSNGAILRLIKERYPSAHVFGIKSEEVEVKNPYHFNIVAGDIEQMELPYVKASFDYIIFSDLLRNRYEPEATLKKVKPYLKSSGSILSCIPNILHSSIILPLMRGRFSYRSSGILNRNHLRFFSFEDIKRLFFNCGLAMDQIFCTIGLEEQGQDAQQLLQQLLSLPGVVAKDQFQAYQFVIKYHHGDRLLRLLGDIEKYLTLLNNQDTITQALKGIDNTLRNITVHIASLSEDQKDEAINLVNDISLKYHGNDIYKAILLLSFTLYEFKNAKSIARISDLIMQNGFQLSVEEKYYALRQLQVHIFRSPSIDTKESQLKVQKVYQHIFDTLCSKYQERLQAIPKEDRDTHKVLVMTDQFLEQRHAPTHSALERSYYLQALGGKRVKIINTLGGSSTKGQLLWWKHYINSQLEEYKDITQVSFKDEIFEFWQSKQDLFEESGISTILDLVIQEKPKYIINIGGQSIIVDMCSRIIPTIAIATVFSKLPVTLGTFSIIGRILAEEEWKEVEGVGKSREAIRELPFTFELNEQKQHFKRDEFRIPIDAFALAIVGTRLTQDIEDEFLNVMERTYEFGTYLVFIGIFDTYESMCQRHKSLREHSTHVGYCHDVLAMMELCDLYVNPKRAGGGFSVIEAFNQGVPGISLSFGDVATAAGPEFCVDTYDEMIQQIHRYRTDSEYYQQKVIQAISRAKVMTDGSKVFLECMESIEKSPLFF